MNLYMRYAIGDIHGGSKTFQALLDRLSLKQGDTIYLLGDYVDRGNDSKGVLDTILQLMDSKFNVHPIRGNHDDMMLRNFSGDHDEYSELWLEYWGSRTLQSFGVERICKLQSKYIILLASLPYVLCEDDFVFVHASLDMTKPDPIHESEPAVMMWQEIGSILSSRLAGRRLVTGHKIRTMSTIISSLKMNHIELDNGAYSDLAPSVGSLVALNLDTMELTTQRWADGEVYP
jgi:serine/threonine protein phosphatase 1